MQSHKQPNRYQLRRQEEEASSTEKPKDPKAKTRREEIEKG